MSFEFEKYNTFVFDCDGVVLDSNKVKTDAFYQTTLPYGEAAALAMVNYHVANGGVSRYKKFAYFMEQIAPAHVDLQQSSPDFEMLLRAYACHVRKGLLSCDVAPGLAAMRHKTTDARWVIVSGGDQIELREVFAKRGISDLFDGGIFGSPDTKHEILAREIFLSNIKYPALFLGDSKYDFQAAIETGLDFVFLSGWSEVADWQRWIKDSGQVHMQSIQSLLE